jgi:hypothetical protein
MGLDVGQKEQVMKPIDPTTTGLIYDSGTGTTIHRWIAPEPRYVLKIDGREFQIDPPGNGESDPAHALAVILFDTLAGWPGKAEEVEPGVFVMATALGFKAWREGETGHGFGPTKGAALGALGS